MTPTDLTPGTTITATTPMGVRRECRIDAVHPNGLVSVSYPLPRNKGRRAWTTERRWLTAGFPDVGDENSWRTTHDRTDPDSRRGWA